jgi:hypothetical protein
VYEINRLLSEGDGMDDKQERDNHTKESESCEHGKIALIQKKGDNIHWVKCKKCNEIMGFYEDKSNVRGRYEENQENRTGNRGDQGKA